MDAGYRVHRVHAPALPQCSRVIGHCGTPNFTRYPNQGVFVVAMSSYVYLVPHVEEEEYVFLNTIIPGRKATRDYKMRGQP